MPPRKRAASAAKKTAQSPPTASASVGGNPLLVARRREVVWLTPGIDGSEVAELDDTIIGLASLPRRDAKQSLQLKKAVDRRNRIREDGESGRVKLILEAPYYRGFTSGDGTEVVGYADLQSDHPPRQNVALDQRLGYNAETYPPALVRLCLVEPVVTDEQWDEFVPGGGPGSVDAYTWQKLTDTVANLTVREQALPKLLPVSALQQINDDE